MVHNIDSNNSTLVKTVFFKKFDSPTLYFPTDAHNVKKRRVIKTF